MRKVLATAFFFLLLTTTTNADVFINEVQPDPANWEQEWVELYNNGSSEVDLTDWKIADNSSSDPLDGMYIENNSFGLILDNSLNCTHFNVSGNSCVNEAAIGSGLDNNGENLTLYGPNGSIIDSLFWDSGPGDNYSIGRVPDGGNWENSTITTPGYGNRIEEDEDGNETETSTLNGTDDEVNETDTKKNRIEITDLPDSASFGETVMVGLDVFRNQTRKYALYIKVERMDDNWDVSKESKVHLKTSSQDYTLKIPVQIKPNCDWEYGNGTYMLTVEGLGTQASENIQISGRKDDVCKETVKVEKETEKVVKRVCPEEEDEKKHEIFSYDERVEAGGAVETELLLRNDLNKTRNLTIYSYIYRDGVPVNEGGWNGNKVDIEMEPLENEVLEMENRIKGSADNGEYSLKVRIKDEKDLSRAIDIIRRENTSENKSVSANASDSEDPGSNVSSDNNSLGNSSETSRTNQTVTGKVFEKKGPLEKVTGIFKGLINFL